MGAIWVDGVVKMSNSSLVPGLREILTLHVTNCAPFQSESIIILYPYQVKNDEQDC